MKISAEPSVSDAPETTEVLQQAGRETATEELGRLLDVGVSSGSASPGEDAFERIRRTLAAEIARGSGRNSP